MDKGQPVFVCVCARMRFGYICVPWDEQVGSNKPRHNSAMALPVASYSALTSPRITLACTFIPLCFPTRMLTYPFPCVFPTTHPSIHLSPPRGVRLGEAPRTGSLGDTDWVVVTPDGSPSPPHDGRNHELEAMPLPVY